MHLPNRASVARDAPPHAGHQLSRTPAGWLGSEGRAGWKVCGLIAGCSSLHARVSKTLKMDTVCVRVNEAWCRNMFFLLVQFPYCQFETAGCGYGR